MKHVAFELCFDASGICWTDGECATFLTADVVIAGTGWRERTWPDQGQGGVFS